MEVIYSPAMVAPNQSFSPSAAKPAAVMAAWLDAVPDLVVLPPRPVVMDDLLRAHQRRYVEDIIALRRPNGFGSHSEHVNASLWQTNGAMLTAARRALATRKPVAAPCSGFHHAGWDFGGGFCTFNGLMVTALALLHDDPKLRIGILDYDYHHGDGTENILDRLKPSGIVHITAGAQWTEPEQASAFLANIRHDLDAMAGCDLVLYQAGADPHIDDPLGGFLTTAQMAMRDWRVFEGLATRGIPVAWNLAGGYQKPLSQVVDLHLTTLCMCLEAMPGYGAKPEPVRAVVNRDRPETPPAFAIERRSGGRDEDRAAVFISGQLTVLVIADGAGGTGGGAQAADCVVAEAEALFRGERESPAMALAMADREISRWGAQSTGIILEIRDRQLCGACVGDSLAWLLLDDACIELSEDQPRKPLLGDGAMPGGIGPLPARGRLLLVTDGLGNYASHDDVERIARGDDLQACAGLLVELPRVRGGEWPDDVAVVLASLS